MPFSSRVSSDRRPNRLAEAVAARRRAGQPILDLTESNPTRAGLTHPARLLGLLAGPAGTVYDPHPLGAPSAREAIAGDYRRRGLDVAADRIVVTSSTSESYALLFKLVGDAGDEVLVPRPSYPLFEPLARLEGLVPVSYRLEYHDGWAIDLQHLSARIGPRTRAVLVVSPNNPTGSFMRPWERDALLAACASRRLTLVVDEVFADYAHVRNVSGAPVLGGQPALTFSLGGLSKSAGLPQVKLGWMAAGGPDGEVGEALDRLEHIADIYLSVSTPVQLAAAGLIAGGAAMRARILRRVSGNLAELRRQADDVSSVTMLAPEAGWSAVLRLPATAAEEDLVVELLTRDGVLVHPGYFFDFETEAFVVVSLLPEPDTFAEGVARLLTRAAA